MDPVKVIEGIVATAKTPPPALRRTPTTTSFRMSEATAAALLSVQVVMSTERAGQRLA